METVVEKLAKAVLTIAADGGMPDSYWATDSRITMACEVLGWTSERARVWASEEPRPL